MSRFNERFSTNDFDQEMMDFIECNFHLSGEARSWSCQDKYLKYGCNCNAFWTREYNSNSDFTLLTKQQFKEKIGMPVDNNTKEETFTKKDLVDGMFVKFGDEDQYRLVLSGNLHGKDGFCPLDEFTESMGFGHEEGDPSDIVEVLVSDSTCDLGSNHEGFGLDSIWKRTPPKSEKVIKLEQLISMHEEQLEATKKLLAEELDNV